MAEDKITGWAAHAILASIIAGGFAAVPFWTWGVTLREAGIAAPIIFVLVIGAYVYVMRNG